MYSFLSTAIGDSYRISDEFDSVFCKNNTIDEFFR